jgi:hypothetical protein
MTTPLELPPEGWEENLKRPPGPKERAAAMGLARGVQPPMEQDEYERAMEILAMGPGGSYTPVDPHRCVYDTAPRNVRMYLQCRVVIPDPRKLRYCLEHASAVNYPLTPADREAAAREEARIRLQGLSSSAVATLERLMQDPDAPAGVRAKAATDVLDRTGFHAKSDLSVQVEATIIDFGAVIKDRLARKAQSFRTIDGEVVEAREGPSEAVEAQVPIQVLGDTSDAAEGPSRGSETPAG